MPLNYINAPQLNSAYIENVWNTLPASIRPTLILPNPALSQRFGCEITIASETFQHTGSFKFRAAYNLLSSIPHPHVIAASSGNFGQAVAYSSKLLGKTCTVVMPNTSARVKIEAVLAHGGEVDLIDVHQISRAQRVAQLLAARPEAFQAQAYDDYRVVVGNSTLGQEILAAGPFDTVIVPVGGGGLASALVVARDHLKSSTTIIGAEPIPGNDAARSLRSGTLVRNEEEPVTLADGARTVSLGQLNWEILQHGLKDIIDVSDPLIIQAVRHYFLSANLKVEPTGALTLGAIIAQPERFAGQRVCCIVSGGNVDPDLYGQVLSDQNE
ncbi:threonine ammonia-lyase [Tengunoibacter tsumagoiensis]|uniref:Serine/threonine dehydratase n=1 Tax=Tengunoibacter tsumagoiensis TaxID=2014871 RepID=A0A402A1Q1_9CHLR|nr:pyridoxal-phosphate dependent enzyme [Tengunoibacter tsumagoiensis]GCE13044.1 serine/threonine dehydratase [Tengunoibacter tsumagoiensis]